MKKTINKVFAKLGYMPKSKAITPAIIKYTQEKNVLRHQYTFIVTKCESLKYRIADEYSSCIIDKLKKGLLELIEPTYYARDVDGGVEYTISIDQLKKE